MDVKDLASSEVADQEPVSEPEIIKKSSRKRSIIIFTAVSILNAALLILLWTQLLTPAPSSSGVKFGSSAGTGYIDSPLIGKPSPDFTLPVISGSANASQLRLADFKGKPVVLNFWASWCSPCQEESPFLQKTWPSLQGKGVVFLGIDGQETKDNALKFIQKYGIAYPNMQDTLDGATAISYGVTSFPETIFINRAGVVVAKYLGPLDEKNMQVGLKNLGL